MSQKKNDYLKEEIDNILNERWGKRLTKGASSIEISNALTLLFVSKVLENIGYEDLSDRYDEGLTDGSGDLGIDFLVKVGRRVHIVQTKYVGAKSGVESSDISHFQKVLHRLANGKTKAKGNAKIKDLIEDLNWDQDEVFLWFVTNSPIENQALSLTHLEIDVSELATTHGFDRSRLYVDYFDQSRLYDALTEQRVSDTRSGIDGVEIRPYKEPGDLRGELIQLNEDELKLVVMVVESEQIARYCRGSTRKNIFDFNIRSYLGDNKKNKQIFDTAAKTPRKFFLFNNGVSAICRKLAIDERTGLIRADGFSIINGAQTVRTLSKLGNGTPISEQPKVMLRITEIEDHKDRKQFLHDLVKYNNTQNEIKTSDFRSNDLVQASLTTHFATLVKSGKRCIYFSRRVSSQDRRSSQTYAIDMPQLAKVVYSYFHDPYELHSSGTSILFDLSREPYRQIFGGEDQAMDVERFHQLAGAFFVGELFDNWLRHFKKGELQKKYGSDVAALTAAKNAIERAPLLLRLLHEFFTRLESEHAGFLEERLLKKVAKDKTVDIFDDSELHHFMRDCFNAVTTTAIYQYGSLSKRPEGLTQRQWLRGLFGVREMMLNEIRTNPWILNGISIPNQLLQK